MRVHPQPATPVRVFVAATALVGALVTVGSEQADTIEPFGPFSWRSGLYEVIQAA